MVMDCGEGKSVSSLEYLGEALSTDSAQPTNFTIKLPATLAMGRTGQKSGYYWLTFVLGNAFPFEPDTGVNLCQSP